MNLLIAPPYYPPQMGGLELAAERLAVEMAKRGHNVHVVTSDSTGRSRSLAGPSVHRLPVTIKVFNTPVSLAAYRVMRKLAEDADLIHTFGYPVFFSDISARVAAERRVPLVLEWVMDPRRITEYRENVIARGLTDFYFKIHGNTVFRRAGAIVLTCEEFRRYLVHYRLIPSPEKLHVIPRAIDTKLFTPGPIRQDIKDSSEFLILYVGRISEQKGLDILLKAFPGVLRECPNTYLVVIGPRENADYWRRIEQYLSKCGGHVRFPFGTKGAPHDQLVEYYRAADVVAFPSRYESRGMVPAEAMACGTPVVGTPVEGNEELIRQAGILVPIDDSRALEEALKRLISNPELRETLSRRGHELVSEEYDWERNADRYEAIYRDLTE